MFERKIDKFNYREVVFNIKVCSSLEFFSEKISSVFLLTKKQQINNNKKKTHYQLSLETLNVIRACKLLRRTMLSDFYKKIKKRFTEVLN